MKHWGCGEYSADWSSAIKLVNISLPHFESFNDFNWTGTDFSRQYDDHSEKSPNINTVKSLQVCFHTHVNNERHTKSTWFWMVLGAKDSDLVATLLHWHESSKMFPPDFPVIDCFLLQNTASTCCCSAAHTCSTTWNPLVVVQLVVLGVPVGFLEVVWGFSMVVQSGLGCSGAGTRR